MNKGVVGGTCHKRRPSKHAWVLLFVLALVYEYGRETLCDDSKAERERGWGRGHGDVCSKVSYAETRKKGMNLARKH